MNNAKDKIFRRQWRGFIEDENALGQAKEPCRLLLQNKLDNGLLGLCAYRWQSNIFVYCESEGEPPNPHELLWPLLPALSIWPGAAVPVCDEPSSRRLIEMVDVFHFNEPASKEHWRRKTPVEHRIGKLGVLKPEAVSSYIYYHYGLQEERTFSGDKYEIIALHENLLFGYFELPEIVEEPLHPPRLRTQSMPKDWSQAQIPEHFIRWPDMPNCLRPMELWLSVWED